MNVAIVDYGAGNLHSLSKAIECCGIAVSVTPDVDTALTADAIVLPGVGAFAPAVKALGSGLLAMRAALDEGFPCVGVCLGMQLLFESSEEGDGMGVGFFQGSVRRLASERVPQIGWNAVTPDSGAMELFDGLELAYYANSFVCAPVEASVVIARTTYEGESFPASVRRRNTVGVQFHPEKSSRPGVELLGRMLRLVTA